MKYSNVNNPRVPVTLFMLENIDPARVKTLKREKMETCTKTSQRSKNRTICKDVSDDNNGRRWYQALTELYKADGDKYTCLRTDQKDQCYCQNGVI